MFDETTIRGGKRRKTKAELLEAVRDLQGEVAQVQAVLRESEARFQDFAKSSSDWLWELDADLRISDVTGFEETTGLKAADVIGIRPGQTSQGEFVDDNWRRHYADLEAHRAVRDFEFRFTGAGGEIRYGRVNGRPVFDEAGKFTGYRGAGSDITDAIQREERLRQVQKMEAVGQLTGGLAHDFNNILGIVIGNLEILERMLPGHERAQARIEAALKGATRGADLTRHLLAFSREKAEKIELVDINASITQMRELLQRPFTRSIDIRTKLAEIVWHVRVDRGDFENSLLNLVLNARDAMAGSGSLSIETENRTVLPGDGDIEAGDYVVVSVSDTGTGMEREVQEKIFEPFFSTKTDSQGTGLGLSMVYGFVQRSRGRIRVHSEKGRGSSFQLFLPRAEGQSLDPDRMRKDGGLVVGGNETILVVDDENLLRNVAATCLRDLGYQVLEAGNGPEALDLLYDYPAIDLVFCDIVMPGGIDGYELARRALDSRPELKILFTSGFTRNHESLAGMDHPIKDLFTHHLHKPYGNRELAHAVRMTLGPTILDNA